MSRKRPHHAASANIPKKHRFIIGATDEHVPFRRKGKRVDVIVMAK